MANFVQGQCYPGEMPDTTFYVCEGNEVHAMALNSEVFSGCVVAYTLHDFAGGFLSNPIDSNLTGTFEMGDANFDEPYYICAVAGVDEDGNGFPDFDHPDTQTSQGTGVQFIENNLFVLDFNCNEDDGIIDIALNKIEGSNPLRKHFVLFHNFGADTLIVNGGYVNLPANTQNLELVLVDQDQDYCYDIVNIEQLQQPCYFDLALRLTERDNKVESYAPQDTVQLKVEVFNQGVLPIKSAELIAYLPEGFSIVSNGWRLNIEPSEAIYFIEDVLYPDSSKTVILELLLLESLIEDVYFPSVEIVSFQSLNGTFLDDIDSTPDNNNFNDLIIDDEILEVLTDEDDHDVSELRVILNHINKFPLDQENLWINAIGPVPVNNTLQVQYQADKHELINIALYNIDGQMLEDYSKMMNKNTDTVSFNLIDLADGIYFIRLSNQHQIVSRRVIKQ